MSEFVLTPDQENAKSVIKAFVLNEARVPDDYFITLAGYAGTGKTTVINSIIPEIKHGRKIVVSAPTHKAKEVIGKITKQNAETIQALLGLRPNIELTDFDPNKPVFEVKAEERIQYYDIMIIDESSMIPKDAVDLIIDKAIEHRVKVIFMGDEYQLPPVGETLGKVFKMPNIVRLDTIVRQSNSNPNQKLIELARNDVRDGTDTCLPYLRSIKADQNHGEGFSLLGKDQFYNDILEGYFDSEYVENPDKAKTIAWTNVAVTHINKYIRAHIIKSKEQVAVGDILMGYNTITKEIQAPPYYIPIVKNSADYTVTRVDIVEQTTMGVTLKGYRVETKEGQTPLFILHRDSYPLFIEEYNDRLEKGKSFKQWKSFYAFKEQIICIENIVNEFGKLVCKKDIDYAYAITVHKSQGSTYENVGVVITDILKNRIASERRKLLYVALSRTSKINLLYA